MQWRYNTLVFYIFQSRVLLTSFCLEPAQTSFLMAYYCLPMDVVSPDVPPVQVLQFRATTTRVPQTIPSRFSPLLWGRDRDPCLLSALFWCIPEPPCGSLSPLCCSMRSLAALPHLSLRCGGPACPVFLNTCAKWIFLSCNLLLVKQKLRNFI